MSPDEFAMMERMQARLIELSAEKAALLTSVGMLVTARLDNGSTRETRTTSRPWKLGHGAWVVSLEGFSGGYDCGRVMPLTGGAAAAERKEAA